MNNINSVLTKVTWGKIINEGKYGFLREMETSHCKYAGKVSKTVEGCEAQKTEEKFVQHILQREPTAQVVPVIQAKTLPCGRRLTVFPLMEMDLYDCLFKTNLT